MKIAISRRLSPKQVGHANIQKHWWQAAILEAEPSSHNHLEAAIFEVERPPPPILTPLVVAVDIHAHKDVEHFALVDVFSPPYWKCNIPHPKADGISIKEASKPPS